MSTTTPTPPQTATWSLPNDPQLPTDLAAANSPAEVTRILDRHNVARSEYIRGRCDLIALGEPIGQLLEHLTLAVMRRAAGREPAADERRRVRDDLADGLRQVAAREAREAAQMELLPRRPASDDPPTPPYLSGNPEMDGIAFADYLGEQAEHESRMALAADRWS